MERRFKVYVYREGELPITHYGPCKDIYTIEGRFMSEIEHGAKRFRTSDPHRAHVYYLPFSVAWMVKYLYKPLTYDLTPLKQFVADYVNVVSSKYPFWNRTCGADHFMLACHDWVRFFTSSQFIYISQVLSFFGFGLSYARRLCVHDFVCLFLSYYSAQIFSFL